MMMMMRLDGTHRVVLDWLFQRVGHDESVYMKYVFGAPVSELRENLCQGASYSRRSGFKARTGTSRIWSSSCFSATC